jgi:catechol 2,3-dioxygenase-like lactoylglutathione lyase family enzyme
MIKKVGDIALGVTDLDRAIDFYENVLGLQKKQEIKDGVVLDGQGLEIVLLRRNEVERYRTGEPEVGFVVNDLHRAFQFLRSRKTHCIKAPHESPLGQLTAEFSDPDGNRFRLMQDT